MVEKVDLQRYEITGRLGSGADYDVRAATDRQTGEQVAIKRPMPQAISRQQHHAIEARTDRLIEAFQEVGAVDGLAARLLGFTDRANHDAFFGDEFGEEYTVIVQARAGGIPLLGDMMSRIRGVPIGAGQNLFAVFPLVRPCGHPAFPVHNQLLDLEQAFLGAGYILLDLRPQNVFFQPGTGDIEVIDTGALAKLGDEAPRGRPPFDANDACLEMLKFYTTPEEPPAAAAGYRDARGIRPIVNLQQELDEMARGLRVAPGPVEDSGAVILEKVRARSYTGYVNFKTDLNAYLSEVISRNEALSGFPEAKASWLEALQWLRDDHWTRFIFDADTELTGYV